MLIKVNDEHFQDVGLKGWVEIDLPNPIERMALASNAALEGNDLASNMKVAENMAKVAWDRIKALELSHESGLVFKSLDDLSQFALCNKLLYSIGGILINGMPLGKN